MWRWEQERRKQTAEPVAQLGMVTLAGEDTAVNLGGERRWMEVCAPGGYSWRPRQGEQVLVLKPEQGEDSCVVGVMETEGGLQPGQVRISGQRCAILLGDKLELRGDVELNGQPLDDYIRAIVADMLSGG